MTVLFSNSGISRDLGATWHYTPDRRGLFCTRSGRIFTPSSGGAAPEYSTNGYGWAQLALPSPNGIGGFGGFVGTNLLTMWCYGDTAQDPNKLFLSSTQGDLWVEVPDPLSVDAHSLIGITDSGLILAPRHYSADTGATWTSLNVPSGSLVIGNIQNRIFRTDDVSNTVIWYSDDLGASWIQVAMPGMVGGGRLVSEGGISILCWSGILFRSVDSGASWSIVDQAPVYDALAAPGHGFIGYAGSYGDSYLYSSTDGLTWTLSGHGFVNPGGVIDIYPVSDLEYIGRASIPYDDVNFSSCQDINGAFDPAIGWSIPGYPNATATLCMQPGLFQSVPDHLRIHLSVLTSFPSNVTVQIYDPVNDVVCGSVSAGQTQGQVRDLFTIEMDVSNWATDTEKRIIVATGDPYSDVRFLGGLFDGVGIVGDSWWVDKPLSGAYLNDVKDVSRTPTGYAGIVNDIYKAWSSNGVDWYVDATSILPGNTSLLADGGDVFLVNKNYPIGAVYLATEWPATGLLASFSDIISAVGGVDLGHQCAEASVFGDALYMVLDAGIGNPVYVTRTTSTGSVLLREFNASVENPHFAIGNTGIAGLYYIDAAGALVCCYGDGLQGQSVITDSLIVYGTYEVSSTGFCVALSILDGFIRLTNDFVTYRDLPITEVPGTGHIIASTYGCSLLLESITNYGEGGFIGSLSLMAIDGVRESLSILSINTIMAAAAMHTSNPCGLPINFITGEIGYPPGVYVGPAPVWDENTSAPIWIKSISIDPVEIGLRSIPAFVSDIAMIDLLDRLNRPFDKSPQAELILRLRADSGLSWSVSNGALTINKK